MVPNSLTVLSLLVVVGLVDPLAAQDVASTGLAPSASLVETNSIATKTSMPLRAAIASNGALLAQQPATPGVSGAKPWSSVQRLKPGVDLVITRRGTSPEPRVAVSADERMITVLDLSDPALPPEVVRALRGIAAARVDALSRRRGRIWMGGVRLEGGAVFFRDQQVADVAQLLETLPQDEVVLIELGVRERARPRAAFWTSLIGGAGAGGWVICTMWQRAECTSNTKFAVGAAIGAGVGAIVGRRFAGRADNDDGVVYRESGGG